ncbi:hypothetical protein [Streptomyces heilongjiangensis]|uniref:Uncharacterized protein n=1 Tax=Streptomyces heilongjiangensis TaxID=945052 RepID=A0ABW1BAW8_9ACTN|nr:hypothetical protein [Streptomyces heilongjiangensis]MDC2946333.1 hypothetical protein [Streptomyces heilongjiangensis]
MDFNITVGEEAVVFHVASLVQDGLSPTDDDLAKELGEEVRPVLQSLLDKGWLVVDEDRELALSTIARHIVSSRRYADGPPA